MIGRKHLAVTLSALVGLTVVATAAVADGGGRTIREDLSGYQEDPAVISTTGNGQFRAQVKASHEAIRYRLHYANLEGAVAQAHIHFGGRAQSGGISVFLCTNLGNGPVGTQTCPASPGTVSGTIRPVDVLRTMAGTTFQGIDAGEFDELVAAIEAGKTYVNVHSDLWPGGEIRAQLRAHR